ncbi:hypothetical protein C4D60_Mb11t14780 [Musa balbisiana]|uniref:Transmembrane protein n=1 Tax=Musa balbisiana TaxID=52838 RepID=A0A4S8J480_MUSBA|nr:hypothetical protein C4D60_Mb11t14780 [Musa balbisiana]
MLQHCQRKFSGKVFLILSSHFSACFCCLFFSFFMLSFNSFGSSCTFMPAALLTAAFQECFLETISPVSGSFFESCSFFALSNSCSLESFLLFLLCSSSPPILTCPKEISGATASPLCLSAFSLFFFFPFSLVSFSSLFRFPWEVEASSSLFFFLFRFFFFSLLSGLFLIKRGRVFLPDLSSSIRR